MIRKQKSKNGKVKFTFVVPSESVSGPSAVVGDFYNWDPYVHPLKKRSNGTHSVVVEMKSGKKYAFRYLADGGAWMDETDADDHVTDEYGNVNCLLQV
jgi:1,4-alpha-glucan branching enzyme